MNLQYSQSNQHVPALGYLQYCFEQFGNIESWPRKLVRLHEDKKGLKVLLREFLLLEGKVFSGSKESSFCLLVCVCVDGRSFETKDKPILNVQNQNCVPLFEQLCILFQ